MMMKLEISECAADKVTLHVGGKFGTGIRSPNGRAILGKIIGRLVFVFDGKLIWQLAVENIGSLKLSPEYLWVAEDLQGGRVLVGDFSGLMFYLPAVPFKLEGVEEEGVNLVIRWDGRRLVTDRQGVVLFDKDRREPSDEDLCADDAHIHLRWAALDLGGALFASAASDSLDREKALRIFTRLETQFDDYPSRRGRCLRRLGELALMMGDEKAALRHWRAAISIDPKCGIAGRLAKLEKSEAS